jgi:type IV pilus assembly protein PilX
MKLKPAPGSRSQRGAVLYVALVILVLLALLGIAAMQVTSLQERMTADYYATSQAFQNAEGVAREVERTLMKQVNGAETIKIDQPLCTGAGFDPVKWADAKPRTSNTYIRRIDKCTSGISSVSQGKAPLNDDPNLIFQVSAYAADRVKDTASDAVVDTIFVP